MLNLFVQLCRKPRECRLGRTPASVKHRVFTAARSSPRTVAMIPDPKPRRAKAPVSRRWRTSGSRPLVAPCFLATSAGPQPARRRCPPSRGQRRPGRDRRPCAAALDAGRTGTGDGAAGVTPPTRGQMLHRRPDRPARVGRAPVAATSSGTFFFCSAWSSSCRVRAARSACGGRSCGRFLGVGVGFGRCRLSQSPRRRHPERAAGRRPATGRRADP